MLLKDSSLRSDRISPGGSCVIYELPFTDYMSLKNIILDAWWPYGNTFTSHRHDPGLSPVSHTRILYKLHAAHRISFNPSQPIPLANTRWFCLRGFLAPFHRSCLIRPVLIWPDVYFVDIKHGFVTDRREGNVFT